MELKPCKKCGKPPIRWEARLTSGIEIEFSCLCNAIKTETPEEKAARVWNENN